MGGARFWSGSWPAISGRWILLVAAIVLAGIIGGCAGSGEEWPNQVLFQSSIVNDREGLFSGVLTYEPLERMDVDDSQRLNVTLMAVGENPEDVFVPDGEVVGSRSLRVGGSEEATLSESGRRGRVDIAAVGSTRGMIGKPGDELKWSWDITPKEPGEYILELVVITYQGASNNPLEIVNPPIQVPLSVSNTLLHIVKSMVGWIIALGTLLAAITGIVKFRDEIFGRLSKRRGETAKEVRPGSTPAK